MAGVSDQAEVDAVLDERARARDPDLLEQLLEWATCHEQWRTRITCLRLLAEHYLTDSRAVRVVGASTHDPVDWVAFTAIRLAGEHRLRPLIPDLIKISGWPSNFMREDCLRKPVGFGAALTKRALIGIFGTADPDELRRLEDEYVSVNGARRSSQAPIPADVVRVPPGSFVAGAAGQGDNPFRIDDTDNPVREVDLPEYWIDRTAVTNARYRVFLESVDDFSEFDHPDQEPGKDHTPAHWGDPRFSRPGLPVVGADWYDAWAFARWAGGTLPSEDEWEKAARGTDAREFPWGETFDPDVCNHVGRAFGRAVADLEEWEELLSSVELAVLPQDAVLPADDLAAGASPCGALQMAGNVWEMTRTNYFTGEDMDPFFKGRRPAEFMNRKDAFHVLRGGAWTSPSPCLTTHFRGRDLITDRHNEVGFRCVYRSIDR